MKALVGIESLESGINSLNMLRRLRPANLSVELLHVLDAVQSLPGYGLAPQVDMPAGVLGDLERIGNELLENAGAEAARLSMKHSTKLAWGPISGLLLNEADACRADLIALHRRDLSRLERLFLGSITRAAVLGARQSLLVTKGEVKPEGPIHAVFGLDHSNYCMKTLELLEGLSLQGIRKLTLVSAFEVHYLSDPDVLVPAAEQGDDLEMKRNLEQKSRALCEKFANLGVDCDAIVEEGPPEKVLHNSMAASGADLMVVGAHGHGFLEQLVIGSVSLHQVAAEPYSVLVLRLSPNLD